MWPKYSINAILQLYFNTSIVTKIKSLFLTIISRYFIDFSYFSSPHTSHTSVRTLHATSLPHPIIYSILFEKWYYAEPPYLVEAIRESPLHMAYNCIFCVSPVITIQPDMILDDFPGREYRLVFLG